MRKVKIKQGYSEECTYDDCGRLIAVESSAGVTSLSWNYEDRLIGITYPNSSTNSFGYNPFGARVSKSDSSGTSTYFRAGTSVVSPVLSDGSATYTPGISERRNNNSTYYHPDLKNTTAQTASNETVSGTNQYDAFGNLVDYSGTWSGPFAYGGAFGYQVDEDSGLMILGDRYYDSSTGRFISRDFVKAGSNWYQYCKNNPLKFADPLGQDIIVLPSDPSGLKGWQVDPKHGGERYHGARGGTRYWPKGVDGSKIGDKGLEFHPTDRSGNPNPHWHEAENKNGKPKTQDPHLRPGQEVEIPIPKPDPETEKKPESKFSPRIPVSVPLAPPIFDNFGVPYYHFPVFQEPWYRRIDWTKVGIVAIVVVGGAVYTYVSGGTGAPAAGRAIVWAATL